MSNRKDPIFWAYGWERGGGDGIHRGPERVQHMLYRMAEAEAEAVNTSHYHHDGSLEEDTYDAQRAWEDEQSIANPFMRMSMECPW